MTARVAGILLAAGAGSRLGRPKALVELGGQTLAERGVALLREGGTDPVLVVTGAVPLSMPAAHIVDNPDWRAGMGSSLAAALRALGGSALLRGGGPVTGDSRPLTGDVSGTSLSGLDCAAAVIALADQPLVGAEAVRRLITAYRQGATVAVAAYDGKPRNPVLIAREHWDRVLDLVTGDTGARPFLRAHPELVRLVECGDTGSPDDVDTVEDLARLAGVSVLRSEEKSLAPTGR